MKAKVPLCALLACVAAFLFGAKAISGAPAAPPDPYDRMYPSYVEICIAPQIRRIGEKPGGTAGHAVLFLKGVCLDRSQDYPRLEPCRPDLDPGDPDRGVGISVNKMFQNVNWVGIEGKDFLLRGGLSENEPFDQAAKSRLVSHVMEKGFYRNIAIQPKYIKNKPAEASYERYVAEQSLGTDFALNLGRDVYCGRIPMDLAGIRAIMDMLNGLNLECFNSREGFHWSGIRNNCTHPIYAALSAVGFCKNKSTDRTLYSHLTDPAIPSRLFVTVMRIGNDGPLEDANDLFHDRQFSKALNDFGYLPSRPGVVLEEIPAHTYQNEFFEKGTDLFFSVGLKTRWRKQFDEIRTQPRYRDLLENLIWFRDRYSKARQVLGAQKLSNDRVRAFREKLLACMEKYHAESEDHLRALDSGREAGGSSHPSAAQPGRPQ